VYLVDLFISTTIINVCWLYFGGKILEKEIDYKNKNTIIVMFFSILLLSLINLTFDSFFKIFINYLLLILLYKYIFKSSISKLFGPALIVLIYYFVAEIVFSVVIAIIIKCFSMLEIGIDNNFMVNPTINIVISFIAILLRKIGKNLEDKILSFLSKIKSYEIIIIFVIGISILLRKNANFLGINSEFIMNLIMIIVFSIVMFVLYKEKEKSMTLSQKYDQLLNYIQKYELELTNKSITIHEFKNQIITIKGFISEKNKKANDYINSIISDIKNLEYNNLSGMENIPSGGLKGLIYFKLGDLREKGINVITKVQPRMKKNSFCLKNASLYKDILKIIGVYLDNAIESTMISTKKEIIMEIYQEKKESHFVLTNTHNNTVQVNKLDNVGYSTKGAGRGYGLQLVKNIIDNYENITQTREVTEDYYVVHLIAKNE
jgi:two-component system sensor histidine kinase AgrC